ncbi:MAG: hypothetical protein Q7U51_14530 [Methanoregula sp.]|nr:hypothetical protein [Methanoregula sp.]
MGKKTKDDIESSAKKGKRGKVPFSFLGNQFDTIDTKTVKRHILFLVLASVMAKLLVVFFTISVFHSFIDLFDIGVYFQHAVMPLQGQYPFGAADFQYPILVFVPMMIAIVPALLLQNAMAFVYTFQILMVLCDIVTTLCVYLIGLRLWDERTALYSGLLYATAFSAAYFVITKYDAFPACLLMLAITFTIYGKEFKGYAASVLGLFTKVFPILALPFFVLYNSKETSIRQEVISAAKVFIPISVVLFLPLFLLSPDTLKIYIPIRSELGFYSNTVTFTLYSWINDVFKLSVSIEAISAVMYILMGIGILAILYIAYIFPDKNPKLLIKLILCAIILVIICAKVRSPQYIVWFTPLICILAVDDIKKIVLIYVVQALAYIEFPLMFGAFYTAIQYTEPMLSSGWMLTLMMFTLEYLALFVCVWFVVNPREIYTKIRVVQK